MVDYVKNSEENGLDNKMNRFAGNYDIDDDGLIVFPSDRKRRQELMHQRIEHPATNNIYMIEAVVEYLTQPGDMVLDPMLGGGSTMVAANSGRKVVGIELNNYFYESLIANSLHIPGDIRILKGDCREVLGSWPDVFNLVIFSPPYSNTTAANTGAAMFDSNQRAIAKGISAFAEADSHNLGQMTDFWFSVAMKDVLKRCFQVTKPDGYMVIIIKDRMKAGIRVELGKRQIRMAYDAGYKVHELYKRFHIGAIHGRRNLARGIAQVTDEHILMFRKPIPGEDSNNYAG